MSKGSFGLFLDEIGSFPVLDPEQEKDLILQAKNGKKEALNQLINCNLRLVVHTIKKMIRRWPEIKTRAEIGDLVQEGTLGLYKAIEKFDPGIGGKFSTYATWWIQQKILRALSNTGGVVRFPVNRENQIRKIYKSKQKLRFELDREPNYEEIAKDLNITPGRVKENEEFFKLFKLYSLDRLILVEEGRDSGRMEELINLEEGTESSVEKEVAKEDLKQNLNQILNEFLSPRQVEIIKMRFGLEPYFEPHTFQQIGRKFGITKQGAQIIFKKALKKLRHPTRIKKLKSLKVYLT